MSIISSVLELNEHLKNQKKNYGIFFTPDWVVDFMVNLIDIEHFQKKNVTILEPACGFSQFLIGIKRNTPILFEKAELIGVEINEAIINYLTTSVTIPKINIVHYDYLLWESNCRFDVIIGNPPYGIPSLSEHYTIKVDNKTKQKYKRMYETWYGKYNVYGAFIEKSCHLLKNDGQLIFIVPATFMILDEFKMLRRFLSVHGSTKIIYLGTQVFKPRADISAVVLNFKKTRNSSGYLELMEYKDKKKYGIKKYNNWQGEVVTFETEYTKNLDCICSYRFNDIFDIKISPRTPEIKNNPYIVRNKIDILADENEEYFPILTGCNLQRFKISYKNLSGYWIKKKYFSSLRNFFYKPHIVVGLGFREKGRIGAAYDERCYPWMGDVYHLIRKNNVFTSDYDLDDLSVVEFLNSDYIMKYFNDTFREITFHLSISMLKKLPLPNAMELKELKENL